jgi:hypothetical protein
MPKNRKKYSKIMENFGISLQALSTVNQGGRGFMFSAR